MTDQAVSRTPELEELLELAIKSFLGDLHTALPGRVEEYSPDAQKVDVKPLIKRRIVHEDGTELLEELPIIPDVPVLFPRSAGFFMSFPIVRGDLVMLHFVERSIDKYLETEGEDTDPDEFRTHDLTDAVAVPGFYPFKLPIQDINTTNLVLGKDEGGIQIHFTPEGSLEVKLSGTSDDAVMLGNVFKMWWDASVKPWLDTHVHPTGTGPSGPPGSPSPAFDTSIISQILKLKGP